MRVSLRYGQGTRELVFPDSMHVTLLAPATQKPLERPAALLHKALQESFSPSNMPVLHALDMSEPRSASIVIPDETRPFPVREFLPVLLEHLRALWPALVPDAVTIFVGGGLHPPMDEDGLARVAPPEVRHGCRVVPHDAKNDPMLDLGVTSRGTPVLINRAFAEADLRIVMGQIDPHQFVGFTGGSKGACIGLASAETIRSNHSLMFEPGAEAGELGGNPVRQDLNEAGDMLGIHLVVNVVNNPQKKPVWLGVGEHRQVLENGAEVCAKVYGVKIAAPHDMVVASCGGSPKDICLYQAQKGLNLASRAVKPGGKLLLLAACEQGVGDEEYYKYVRRFDSIQAAMDDFKSRDFQMGAHKAYLFAKSLLDYDVVMNTGLDTRVMTDCQVPSGDAQEIINHWLGLLPPDARVAVVPNANTTFFY